MFMSPLCSVHRWAQKRLGEPLFCESKVMFANNPTCMPIEQEQLKWTSHAINAYRLLKINFTLQPACFELEVP